MRVELEALAIGNPPSRNYWAGQLTMPDGEVVAVRTTLLNAGEVYSYFEIGDQWYYVKGDLRNARGVFLK